MKKKYLYLIVIILVLIILCLLTYKSSTSIKQKKNDAGITYNLGKIKKIKNSKNIHLYDFKYINRKFNDFVVYDVIDGCDCTKSYVKKGRYLKNDTIVVKTKYDPLKYNDSGYIIKYIFLVTNQHVSKYDTIYPFILKGKIE